MHTTVAPPRGAFCPTSLSDLEVAERLIVSAFRRWVLGFRENRADHWSYVWNDFARQFGARDGKEALAGFAATMKCVQCYACRKIRHHRPCCPHLADDEVAVLYFLAACQSQRWPGARTIAQRLVMAEGIGELICAGTRLAHVLRRHGQILPHRAGPVAGTIELARPAPARATVH